MVQMPLKGPPGLKLMDAIFLSSFIGRLRLPAVCLSLRPDRMPGLLWDQALHPSVEHKPPHTDIEQQADTDSDG